VENKFLHPLSKLDEKAFEDFFRVNYKGLSFFAIRYVRDLEIAKEIVQEAFIGLWEKRETFDSGKSLNPYLSVAIKNKCLNYLRDNKRFNVNLIIEETAVVSMSYEPEDVFAGKDLQEAIDRALNELLEKCREVFTLNRYEDLKYGEIAIKLQISLKTVESHMSKALRHMRNSLEKFMILIFIVLTFLMNR
jgi:RNA polymerase sigma-70 factor, ECF subfamily